MDRRRFRVAVTALALVGALSTWTVSTQLFPFHSVNHDEAVYLQQAAMLLEGQLFLSPPVEDAFRPWFFVDSGDRLYPKYAPLTAGLFALGELAWTYRLTLPLVAAGNLALVAGVVSEVFNRRTGLLAGVLLLGSPLFLIDSAVFLPYAPTTMFNLAFAYAYLRGDRTGDRRWAAAAGGAVGLAFFARPYTAILFATPFICHALWTLHRDGRETLFRQALTAAGGLLGVAVTLDYNAVMTGHALVFPYEAFAPRDGLGFGQRRILGHAVDYSVDLALRSNGRVLTQFVMDWVAGGLLGTALVTVGLIVLARRSPSPRQLTLAGLLVTVPVGNVYFWGNYNVLGDLDRAGDGLIAVLGPYYHFDLLVPFAAFAAVGTLALVGTVRGRVRERFDQRRARAVTGTVILVGALVAGGVTVGIAGEQVERNAEATAVYERAYAPFDDGAPQNALVFVPAPYGDWLNHPFQPLRNDPGFDGETVYALEERPFAVVDAHPDRRLYRYTYRGQWDPLDGSPEDARLRRVESVAGERVALNVSVGVPSGASSVTVRVGTDEGSAYTVTGAKGDTLDIQIRVTEDRASIVGANGTVAESAPLEGREEVVLTAFVDTGPGGSFTYRVELPVDATDGRVRALSPHLEYCRGVRTCGGAGAYVPSDTPDGVFVETTLSTGKHNR